FCQQYPPEDFGQDSPRTYASPKPNVYGDNHYFVDGGGGGPGGGDPWTTHGPPGLAPAPATYATSAYPPAQPYPT
ncbi:unnamed protein product, partial [Notodromas monacha]